MIEPDLKNNIQCQELVNRVYQENDYDFVAIALQNNQAPFFAKWYYAAGNLNERFRRINLRPGWGICGIVLKTGKPFLNNNLDEYMYTNRMYTPIAQLESLKAAAAVPMINSEFMTVQGVLLAGYRSNKDFTEDDIQKLFDYLI